MRHPAHSASRNQAEASQLSLSGQPFAAEGPAPGQRRPLVVSSFISREQLRQLGDVGGDAPGLVAGEELGLGAASRFLLEIGEHLPLVSTSMKRVLRRRLQVRSR